jgi:hypothetical protein
VSIAKGTDLGGRKNPPVPLRATDLWKLAEMLWRFHETGEHEAQAEIMAVHHVVVETAEAMERRPAKRRRS